MDQHDTTMDAGTGRPDDDFDELQWRIYEPRQRRMFIYTMCRPDEPRMWLMDADDGHGPAADILWLKVDRETYDGRALPACAARMGSWKRYRQEVEWLRALIAQQGWTLTDDEAALIASMEAFLEQAPAWLQTAA